MNWGILSTGVIARNFAETARRMGDEVTLYAVASRSRESADAFADQYGIPVRYASAEDLARDSMLIRHDPLRLAFNIMLMADIMVPRKGILRRYDQMLLGRE